MPDDPNISTNLIDKQYKTLIVRLLVDIRQGQLQLGHLVDLNENSVGRFRQLGELPSLIARWLESWIHEQKSSNPISPLPDSWHVKSFNFEARTDLTTVRIKNLTNRPVILSLNSGRTLHLSPRTTSRELRDVEVKSNAKVEKLQKQRVISVD